MIGNYRNELVWDEMRNACRCGAASSAPGSRAAGSTSAG